MDSKSVNMELLSCSMGKINKASAQRRFACNECGKSFTTKFNLKEHIRCSTEEKRLLCEHCGRRYSRHTTFYGHKKTCQWNISSLKNILALDTMSGGIDNSKEAANIMIEEEFALQNNEGIREEEKKALATYTIEKEEISTLQFQCVEGDQPLDLSKHYKECEDEQPLDQSKTSSLT